jgi:hypothetical protein
VVENEEYPRLLLEISEQTVSHSDYVAFTPQVEVSLGVKPFLDHVAALAVGLLNPKRHREWNRSEYRDLKMSKLNPKPCHAK